jgi:precorrin-6B C5,15-methyltransferase / cobalt-precorrin-6B C5,C15-methyltransferase
MPNEILLIGVGAKGRQSLTDETLRLLETSQTLIGGKKLLSQFKDLPAKTMILPSDLSKLLKVLKENPDETLAILALGNENLYGLSRFLHQRFNKGSLRVIQNMEQMKLAFSAAKLPMDGARILTAMEINLENVHEWFQPHQTTGIFSDPMITPSVIAKALFKQGIKDLTAYVCQDVGTKRTKIIRSDIEGLLGRRFPPLSILLLTPASSTVMPAPRERPTETVKAFGIPDAQFVHTDRIPLPQEVRLICLAKLSLTASNTLWDIGAGCGAASIEGSRMLSSGDVYAIERDYVQIRHLYENIKRFAVQNVTVIEGEPLEALKSIPDPDRVLVQGGSTRMKEIVEVAWLRLKSQGVLVICTRNDQDLAQIRDFLRDQDLPHELIAIHISKIVFQRGAYPETALTPLYLVVTEKK